MKDGSDVELLLSLELEGLFFFSSSDKSRLPVPPMPTTSSPPKTMPDLLKNLSVASDAALERSSDS
jgi:hypothetical protein